TNYALRKNNQQEITPIHPELAEPLRDVLELTYGLVVYQEQVQKAAQVLAGYSLGQADLLRRAMGKKKVEEMAKHRATFIKGASERGFPQKKIEKIFDLMAQFAGYGFNKSHSAAYAFLAFGTAYLKAHYPVDFMAALLTSETGNTAKVVKYINECRDMGIEILPPDVNHSEWSFTPDDHAPGGKGIRFGLGAVKNVGQSAVESIAKARAEKGKFRSLHEFCENVDLGAVNRRMIESLIRAGAMDSLEGTRSQKFAAAEGAMEAGQRAWRDRESGQGGLFGEVMAEEHQAVPLPNVPEWTDKEKLAGEKELLGFWVTGHPLDRYSDKIGELATHDSSNLEGLEKGTEVRLCGVLTGITRKRNKEGKPWAAMTIEDRSGSIEGLLFASSYERLAPQVQEDSAVFLTGLVLPEENSAPKISIQEIVSLDNARVDMPKVISIRVWLGRNGSSEKAGALDELFRRKPGETQVRLRLEMPRDFVVLLDIPAKVRPDKEFKAAVEAICGAEAIERVAG
ncbi:MAG TPA: OB-fold nucleic acid binding domain-containing protein, partial [Bryobacteraceae bacterium]